MGWDEFVAYCLSLNTHERKVSLIIHPNAISTGIVISPKWGNVRAEVGPIGFMWNTGERGDP